MKITASIFLIVAASEGALLGSHAATRPICRRPVVRRAAARLAAGDEEGDDDGTALFKPFSTGDGEVSVPDSSKRLFIAVLAAPALLLLAGVATYNPTDEELAAERQRQALRLRGGMVPAAISPRRAASAARSCRAVLAEQDEDDDSSTQAAPGGAGGFDGEGFGNYLLPYAGGVLLALALASAAFSALVLG